MGGSISTASPFADPYRHHGDAHLHGPDGEALHGSPIPLCPSHFAQDLWNICRVLGIKQFVEEEDLLLEMVADITRAQRLDRKASRKADAESLGSGLTSQFSEETNHCLDANLQWITRLRQWCADSVIRRAIQSRDYKEEPISGLIPYHEHLICMALLPTEMEAHEEMIQEFLDSGSSESVKNRRVCAMAILDSHLHTNR